MARGRRIAVPRLDDLVERAGLIFSGTVRRLSAAAMPGVPVSDATAVVAVDEVLRAPAVLGALAGSEVTVLLQKPRGTQAGSRAVFFTTAWLYGQSLAVTEVGRMSSEGDLRRRIADASARNADRRLQARLDKADLVVSGRVAETRPVQKRSRVVSEHDPHWWQAVIDVGAIDKGRVQGPRLTVLFASSTDELWIDSPKLRPEQEGVFILQRDQQERGAPVFRVPGYTVLDPLDVLPTDQQDRVRSLIRKRR